MSFDIKELQYRLQEWGQWRLKVISVGVGYSGISIFGKIFNDGGFLPPTSAPMNIPTNIDAEEIDALVNEMSQYRYLAACRDSLIIRYASYNEKDEMAKRGLAYGTHRKCLDVGKAWLMGRLKTESEKH